MKCICSVLSVAEVMYEITIAFKARRKYYFLLFTWITVFIGGTAGIPTTTVMPPFPCPDPCECFLNTNGLQSARCSELTPGQLPLPNIHVLFIESVSVEFPCDIPANVSTILPQLSFIYLNNCSLTNLPVDSFSGFSLLEEVDVSNNYLKVVDPSMFLMNKKLRYVNFQNNPLFLTAKPFLSSKSIWELDLSLCNLAELPFKMFKNLTSLKYLQLNDNRLETIAENTLPNKLKTLNLAKNSIRIVPTNELIRLTQLKQIDLSKNPINCTCSLMGFQNWVSGKGEIFENEITCAYPRRYAGQNLLHVSQYDLCDARVEKEITTEMICGPNQICSNLVEPMEDGYLGDGPQKKSSDEVDFEKDHLVPVQPMSTSSESAESFEASGDGTDIPIEEGLSSSTAHSVEPSPSSTEVSVSSTTETEAVSYPVPSTAKSSSSESSSASSTESSTSMTTESTPPVEVKSKTPAPAPEVVSSTESPTPSSTKAESSTPVSTQAITSTVSSVVPDAETIKPLSDNNTSSQEVAGLQLHNDSLEASALNFSYIIPFAAIFLIIIICLGVFLGQRSSQKTWKPNSGTNAGNDGTEMQDVSLLPGKSPRPSIVKNKYSSEKESEQTQRLMGEIEAPAPKSVWEHLEVPIDSIENGSIKHIDEDDEYPPKLPNGQSTADKNVAQPIECTIAKVTTLPDSIPRTPIVIRNV